MSKSAKGTVENPGTYVAQKSGLNRSILRNGWSDFHRMLEYKLKWRGGKLIKIPPPYTSQTCSECGYCHSGNRIEQALFKCQRCGFSTNADVNACINIKRAGIARFARDVNDTSHPQREPTEVIRC